MNLRLKPLTITAVTFVCLAATLIGSHAKAESEEEALLADSSTLIVEDHRDQDTSLVEIHYPIDLDAAYKDRRTTSAFTFGLNYESFYPEGYTSIIFNDTSYEDMFGKSEIPMISLDIGYKYNFTLGSLIAGIGIGQATLSEQEGPVRSDIDFVKSNAYLGYVMDNVMSEPYVAPYFMGGTTMFSITESSKDKATGVEDNATGSTQTSFFYRVGALIQLNWLEDDVSRVGLLEHGLQNTYLDLFMTKYTASIAKDDPDIETDLNYGAGLRVEF